MKKMMALVLALAIIFGLMPPVDLPVRAEETNPWSGRSAVFVGDSITAGSGTTKVYYEYLEESLGFDSVTAMGVAGSCISAASDYGQSNQPLINRYQNISSADLIVIFMGTNDYGHETPLGSREDTQDGTFYGALNVIIPALVANHPSSKIVFVTPLHRYGFGTSKILGTQFTSDDIANGVGAALGDYVEALKTVCADHGVSVIDLYTECTLDPADAEVRSAYMPDGLHPNAAGHEWIAGILESHIRGFEPSQQEPVEQTEMVYGNRFAPGNDQTCRASSRINYYLKAGTIITLKDPAVMQWACTKTSNETSSGNLGYFPDSGWSDKETAVVEKDGWVGFVFKYRDETKVFDLSKPLSDYITIEGPHSHTYENGVCTGCGATTSPYLQQLPENITGCSNLYGILTPTKGYYTATKYDTSNGAVLSVVIPVEPGDRIAASSFGPVSENMGSVDGIRVTYLLDGTIVESLSAGSVYAAYTQDGYLTVPEGVNMVSIPWWKPSDSNWLTLRQISKNFVTHNPKTVSAQAPTCTENGYTAGEICENCHASLGSREEIPATGHNYSGNTCIVCGKVNILAILAGMYVSILGDSISTFNGYSNDATVNTTIGGNAPRYDTGTADTKPGSYCLLESVDDTWWMHFANRSGMKLLVNNSWAGSQVFGGQTSDGRVIPAAYLERCVNLHDNTLENNPNNAPINPDIIFVYLGINDYNFNRGNVGNGAVDYAALINSDGTYVRPATFGEAYAILLHKMQQAYPNAQIFAMTLLPENLYSVDQTVWEQHNAYIRAAAEYYDIPVVDLAEKCAITWDNYSGYMMDKIHPTTAGMELISDCIEAELVAYYTAQLPHTHTFGSWITTTWPTCVPGEQQRVCTICSATQSRETDAVADHIYANGICAVCGEMQPMDAITDKDALVLAIRQAMLQRQTLIQLRLDGIALSSSEVSSLISQARAHTGVPNEGDYIRANMVGYSWSLTTGSDANGVYSIVTITCNFLSDAQMEAEVDAALEEILNELDLWDASNYEKVKGIYDWITENVDYDYPWDDLEDDTTYYKHTTHAALIRREAVCQGIASLYYRMMLELGVDCRYISGVSTDITGTENHAWNIVYLEGKYYNCDPTWDLGLTGHYRYFLCTESNFEGHTRDTEFDTAQFHAQYPMAVTPYVLNVAASGQVNANIAWVLDGDTGTLTVAGTGAIPSYRFSYAPWYEYRESVKKIVVSEGITEVGERAFYWCTNCTEVVLPDSLVAIREYGFNNLRNLKTITLPPNLRIIEFCAFSECVALTSITLPDSVTTVGSNAFSNCYALTSAVLSNGMKTIPSSMFGGDSKLKSVQLPEGITYIDDTAFINCGFTEFTLPASVTGLGTSVFSGCTSLTRFVVEAGNTAYKAVEGVLFTADGTHLVCYPAAKTGNYTVPEGTLYIDYGAFRSQKYLFYVYFPSTLIEIDGYAFSYCTNLYSLTFNSNITTIGSDAFRSCTNLKSVTFENPNVNLVGYTFVNCTALRTITLPSNLKEIPNGLFDGCSNLQSINIPSTVTKIGSSAFLDCDSLTTITIPGNVKSIGQQAFDFCNKLETIIFEEGVTTLGWICIRNAPKLKKVVIPSTVTKIEQPSNTDSYLFEGCPNVVLYVICGSYGYTYAVNHGVTYQVSHTIKTTVVYPTCTEQGYTRYGCRCGAYDERSDYTPALGHEYEEYFIPPTCDWEGYTFYCCIRCGDAYCDDYVPPAHNFGDWYVEFEPTCTTDGEKWRYCFDCGYWEFEAIPATGHNYMSVVTAPTCTEQGYTTHTCANCGDSYVDTYAAASGHDWDEGVVILEPTEESEGERLYTCQVCGATRTEVIPTLDHVHSYDAVVTAPTCTEQGYTTHTCRCGDTYVDTYIPATGHSYGAWYVVKDATCTADGQKRHDCANCNHYETEAIPATGHSYTSVVTAPTCTEQGFTTHTCANCGDSYVDTYTAALGHDWDEGVVILEPTEESEGERLYTCQVCGATRTEVIPTLDHVHSYDAVVTAATCTEQGYTTHTCRCGDTYVDTYIPATGHSYEAWYVVTEATCTEDGQKRHDCANCDHYETAMIPATGHNYTSVVTAPTCTEQGYTTHTCANCGDSYVDSYIPAKGHAYGGWYVVTQETCTADGLKRHDCANCDHYETAMIPATGHNYTSVVTAPTCTEQGFTTHTCANCGDRYVDSYVDATGHSFGEWLTTSEPTCTEKGSESRVCACGEVESREIAALGHQYDAVVTAPTCTEQGFTTHTCARCGNSYVDSYIPAKGHSYVVTAFKDATCTEDGYTTYTCHCGDTYTEAHRATGHNYRSSVTTPTCTEQGYTTHTCANCGDSYVDSYVEANGHSYGGWYVVTQETCTEDGQKRHDCVNCAYYETEVISAIGHNYTAVVTAPTCTEQGYTTHTCVNCGDTYVDTYVCATGHSFELTERVEPTCTKDGYLVYTCHCGEEQRETLPSTGHGERETRGAVEATCTEDGYSGDIHCADCGKKLATGRVLPATGHDYVDGECRHCGEKDPEAIVMGDANGDGTVNYLDAMLIAQYYVGDIGEEDLNLAAADVNGDGVVNYLDAMMVAQYYVGDIDSFPAEN